MIKLFCEWGYFSRLSGVCCQSTPCRSAQGFRPGRIHAWKTCRSYQSLASYDPSNSSWIADAGDYTVKIGASSGDIRQNASFMLSKDILVKKETKALVPLKKIDEL
jgi:hypothetical protein